MEKKLAWLVTILILIIWLAAGLLLPAKGQVLLAEQQSLASFINAGRSENAVRQLRLSASLTAQAQARVEQIAASGDLSSLEGEMVTAGFFSGFQTWEQLKANPLTRARLLDCQMQSVGIGYKAVASGWRYYWVVILSTAADGDFFPSLNAPPNSNEIHLSARTGLGTPGVLVFRFVGTPFVYAQTEHRILATGVCLTLQYSKAEAFRLFIEAARRMTASDRAQLIQELQAIQ